MLEKVKATRGLIFDVRGYPKGTGTSPNSGGPEEGRMITVRNLCRALVGIQVQGLVC